MAGGELTVTEVPASTRPGAASGPIDQVFSAAIVVCAGITLLLLAGLQGHAVVPALDLVMDTASLIVCGALTTIAWIRSHGRHLALAALQAAGFLALAFGYGAAVMVTLAEDATRGVLSEALGVQEPVFAIAQLVAAACFLAATTQSGRRLAERRPTALLVGSALAVLVGLVIGAVPVIQTASLRIVILPDASVVPSSTLFGAMVHLLTATLFFAGALGSRSLWRNGGTNLDGWIAIGLVFAAFAEVTQLQHPRTHPGHLAVADVLLLTSSVAFLTGLLLSVRDGLRELAAANVALTELRDAEVTQAAFEERARLARELHDGLAQDLWLAKLRTGALASMPELPAGARRLAAEAGAAIDAGLGDAREAVTALRANHAEAGLCALIQRLVEDHGDRYGLHAEFVFEGEHDDRIPTRTQAEILRITQEALINVARHADATVVGVRLCVRDRRITLRIVDNGHGFDPRAIQTGTYGLTSMRERASLIGGRLRVLSRPACGTRVVLLAPTTPPVSMAGVAR